MSEDETPKKQVNVMDIMFHPQMINAYAIGMIGLIARAMKTPEGQKRLESFLKSLGDFVGKAGLDNLLSHGAVSYLGYVAGQGPGLLAGNIGLTLAKSSNLAAGASGVAILAGLGIIVSSDLVDSGMDAVTGGAWSDAQKPFVGREPDTTSDPENVPNYLGYTCTVGVEDLLEKDQRMVCVPRPFSSLWQLIDGWKLLKSF